MNEFSKMLSLNLGDGYSDVHCKILSLWLLANFRK